MDIESTLRPGDLKAAAQRAEKQERWFDAVGLWRRYLEEFPHEFARLASYGKALAKINRFEEALEIYEKLRHRDATSRDAFVGAAEVAKKMRNYNLALEYFDGFKSNLPDQWNANWESKRANVLLKLGRISEADAIFANLARQEPGNPSGLLGLAASADLKRDRVAAQALWAQIEQTYPNDPRTRAARIKHELKRGKLQEAAGLLEDKSDLLPVDRVILEAEFHFLNLRYAEAIEHLASAREQGVDPARLWAKELAFRERSILSPADKQQLTVAAGDAVSASPTVRELREAYARALVIGEKTNEARDAVRALGLDLDKSRAGLMLASWAAHTTGDVEKSASCASRALDQTFVASLHAPKGSLLPADSQIIGRARPDLAIFTCVKNEADYLPWFFDYYRRLGIENFFVIDNASEDGTREILATEPDVALFDSRGDFFAAGGGMRWINELVAEHGGRWSIYVDTDEMLIYPDSETKPLSTFLTDVESSGQEAVPAFMIDMYNDTSFELEAGSITDPVSLTPYFDNDYFRTGSPEFPFFEMGGGPRSRLFSTCERLRKVPIIRGDRNISYLNSHGTTPAKLGPHAALLLHFKLIRYAQVADKASDQSRVVSRSQGAIVRHSNYEKMYRHDAIRFAGTTRYDRSIDPHIARLYELVGAEPSRS